MTYCLRLWERRPQGGLGQVGPGGSGCRRRDNSPMWRDALPWHVGNDYFLGERKGVMKVVRNWDGRERGGNVDITRNKGKGPSKSLLRKTCPSNKWVELYGTVHVDDKKTQWIHIQTHTHTHTHTTHTHTHTHTHSERGTHTRTTHTHTRTHTLARTRIRAHTHKYLYIICLSRTQVIELHIASFIRVR